MTEDNIVETKCNQVLMRALLFKASDVQMMPMADAYSVIFRRHNQRKEFARIPLSFGEKMISYLKYKSSLDIAEKRKPQSGTFLYSKGEEAISCRISTLPSVSTFESLIIRLMHQNVSQPLENLAYNQSSVQLLQEMAHRTQGILIFSGPTGCGKSTTMYSLLNYCSQRLKKHVISLEDPVENNQDNLLQIQVNQKAGVTYSEGIRAALRHTPDVIMIGEVRDRETARVAIEAALTGHLVLTTIHAKNPFGSLHRLLDLGITEVELQQTVLGIVSQQLITKIGEEGEIAALFEILYDEHLFDAFDALAKGENYFLPLEKTMAYEMQMGVRNGNIVANYYTRP